MTASAFLKHLRSLSRDDLLEIKGVGEVLANNYLEFLDSDRYQILIQKFCDLENHFSDKSVRITSHFANTDSLARLPLSSDIVCITGTFATPREQIKSQLEALGAKITDSVSTKTTILLAGEKAGSKLAKAQNLGIKIVFNLAEIIGS